MKRLRLIILLELLHFQRKTRHPYAPKTNWKYQPQHQEHLLKDGITRPEKVIVKFVLSQL